MDFRKYWQKFMTWAFVTQPGSNPITTSYLTLRKCIGVIGIALPPFLIAATLILGLVFKVQNSEVQSSVSAYYYTVTGSVFVGSICAVGVFLFCYRYDRLDDFVSNIAGGFAILVGIFPTTPAKDPSDLQKIIGVAHLIFAASFLSLLAVMALALFTRVDPNGATDQKKLRNKVYVGCGIAILVCLVLAALVIFVPFLHDKPWLSQLHPILILEGLATIAFGVAWFIKGETLLKDPVVPPVSDQPTGQNPVLLS